MPSWNPDTWYWFQLRVRAFWMLTVGAGVCCSAFWCLKQGRSFVSRRSSLLEHMRNTHELDPLQVYVTSPPNHLSDLGWDGMEEVVGSRSFPQSGKGQYCCSSTRGGCGRMWYQISLLHLPASPTQACQALHVMPTNSYPLSKWGTNPLQFRAFICLSDKGGGWLLGES